MFLNHTKASSFGKIVVCTNDLALRLFNLATYLDKYNWRSRLRATKELIHIDPIISSIIRSIYIDRNGFELNIRDILHILRHLKRMRAFHSQNYDIEIHSRSTNLHSVCELYFG